MDDGECLVRACAIEQRTAKAGGYEVPLLIDLVSAVAIVGSLQLALRHPEMNGECARVSRAVVAAMIARTREDGFVACADLMELGNDAANDRRQNLTV